MNWLSYLPPPPRQYAFFSGISIGLHASPKGCQRRGIAAANSKDFHVIHGEVSSTLSEGNGGKRSLFARSVNEFGIVGTKKSDTGMITIDTAGGNQLLFELLRKRRFRPQSDLNRQIWRDETLTRYKQHK